MEDMEDLGQNSSQERVEFSFLNLMFRLNGFSKKLLG